MITQIITAIALTLVLILSFYGWGLVTDKLFRSGSVPVRILLGIGLLMSLGGWLNLLGIISPAMVAILICTGILFNIIWYKENLVSGLVLNFSGLRIFEKKNSMGSIILLILLVPLLIYPFLSFPAKFNTYDDYQFYFTLPAQMLETGNILPNPFFAPLIVSGRGEVFLQTFILAFTRYEYAYLIDMVIGSFMVILLVFEINKNSNYRIVFLSLLVFLLIFPPKINSSFVILPLAFFLALLYLLQKIKLEEKNLFIMSGAAGIIIVSLACFKIIYLFYAGLIILLLQVISPAAIILKIKFLLLTVAVFLIFYLPWMIYTKDSFGTLFYPFLGKGTWNTSMQPELNIRYYVLLTFKLALKTVPFVFIFFLYRMGKTISSGLLANNAARWLILVFVFSFLLTNLTLEGMQFFRYHYPVIMAILLFTLPPLLHHFNKKPWILAGLLAMTVLFTGLNEHFSHRSLNIRDSFSINPVSFFDKILKEPPDIEVLKLPLIEKTGLTMYDSLFSSAEPGSTILTYLFYPYLVDYGFPGKIYNMYQPFVVLPGGEYVPGPDVSSFVNYLNNNGIQYIAASLPGGLSAAQLKINIDRTRAAGPMNFHQLVNLYESIFRMYLLEMTRDYPVVFNNGQDVLIDIRNNKS